MTVLQQITVYRIDPVTFLLLYPEQLRPDGDGAYHVPGNCVLVEPPAAKDGKCSKWDSNVPRTNFGFGNPGQGVWLEVDDYRKTDLYHIADGSKYDINSEYNDNSESFPGYGDLPSWLTTFERPSQFHDWQAGAWVLDEAAKLENDKAMERAWRDGEISRITWLRDRHRDETEQSLPATLSEQQYQELIDYIQALRDWPAHTSFPQQTERPAVPTWLAQ